MKTKSLLAIGLLAFGCTSCAMVTTYGKEPVKVSENRYQFKLFYNIASTDDDIRNKAEEIMSQIKETNNHQSCALLRNDTRSQTGVNARASEIFDVECR